jgi:hypothetical protein
MDWCSLFDDVAPAAPAAPVAPAVPPCLAVVPLPAAPALAAPTGFSGSSEWILKERCRSFLVLASFLVFAYRVCVGVCVCVCVCVCVRGAWRQRHGSAGS